MRSTQPHTVSPSQAIRHRPRRSATTTVRIETSNRWDALDLARDLRTWSWYLVSQGVERWDVCVGIERQRRRRATRDLLATVQAWADRRDADAVVRLDDGEVPVHPSAA